jgi:hypothetical protein
VNEILVFRPWQGCSASRAHDAGRKSAAHEPGTDGVQHVSIARLRFSRIQAFGEAGGGGQLRLDVEAGQRGVSVGAVDAPRG